MILDSTTKTIELILGAAATTNAMPVTVDYVDITTTTTVPGSLDSASNGTTLVTIVAAPAASTQRKINLITVYNADTASKAVTIRLNNNTTLRNIVVVTLQVGDTLYFTDTNGWSVLSATGLIKNGQSIAADITFTPAGNVSATNLQTAVVELDTEKVDKTELGTYVETIVTSASPVTLTTSATAYNVASVNLTAGTWLLTGMVAIISGTSDSNHVGGISFTSATLPSSYESSNNVDTFGSGINDRRPVPAVLKVVATTDTAYLVAQATFAGTSPTAFGKITAIRLTAP